MVTILKGHEDGVASVCFSSDGKLLFAGDWLGVLIAWNTDQYTIAYKIQAHSNMIYIHVSPDGKYLASSGDDLKVKIWSCKTGELVHVFSDFIDFPSGIRFSPDSRMLGCGGYDQILRIWDTQSWVLLHAIQHKANET